MCFVKMEIHDMVIALVESMLPRFSDDKTVLVMSFDLRVGKKGDYDGPVIRRVAHLMFHRPHNYTKALWNVSTRYDHYRDHAVWHLRADHDSCWTTDGVSSPFFRLAQEMMRELDPEIGCPDVEITIRFQIGCEGPRLVKLQSYKLDQENRTFTVEYSPEIKATA